MTVLKYIKIETRLDRIVLNAMVIWALIQAFVFSYYFGLGFVEGLMGY